MPSRAYIAIPVLSTLVLGVVACSWLMAPSGSLGIREPSFEEGLYYSVAAKLARLSVHTHCNGIKREGASVRVAACEVITKKGAFVLRDMQLALGAEHTWLPLFSVPTLTVRVGRLTVARAHTQATTAVVASLAASAPAVTKKETPPRSRWLSALPIRIDVARVVAKELPVVVGLSAFGWPLSDTPHGTVSIVGAGARASVNITVEKTDSEKSHLSGQLLASVPPTLLSRLMSKRASSTPSPEARPIAFSADFDLSEQMLAVKGAASSDALCIEHPRFGEGRACDLGVHGAARFALNRDRAYVDAARVEISNTATRASTIVTASGSLPLKRDVGSEALAFELRVPSQDVQDVLHTIPTVWRTGLFGFELEGAFSATFRLAFLGDDFSFDPSFRFDKVRVKNAPPGQDPRRLNGAVSWRMPFPYPHTVSLWGEAGYVQLSHLPQILVDAVRISEDAAFYAHDGFDRSEIAKAIADIKEGNGARGASTITQQLAKNLYFDGDRNLTRKIEEAIVTAALEASVPKWRLLEIYLNVIEWGDGIFGIERASQRYFKKSAVALLPSEAAFLAGIIPAPRKVDRDLKRDGSSPWADKRALRVTKFLCDLGKLDGATCEAAAARSEMAAVTN